MSLLTMPFLVINYGGEMIYILEQRLHAQSIAKDKSNKVLADVTRAMFGSKFISELMKPQDMYTAKATREIFDKLSHSSIMRLSESSMDKLYDLMTMGFKYQIICCTHPRQITDVTFNHLDSIINAVEGPTREQVVGARDDLTRLCQEMSTSEFYQVRQSFAAFFQDKRIKVSLFLQDGIQNPDGRIVLPLSGKASDPQLGKQPGTITYFDGGKPVGEETFQYPLAAQTASGPHADQLGTNLYTIDRVKKREAAKAAAAAAAAPAPERAAAASKARRRGYEGTAAADLNSLAGIIGVSKAPEKALNLSLFPDQADGADGDKGGTQCIVIPKMTREELEKHNKELVGVMNSMDLNDDGTVPESEDLLALMDGAGGDG